MLVLEWCSLLVMCECVGGSEGEGDSEGMNEHRAVVFVWVVCGHGGKGVDALRNVCACGQEMKGR